MIDDRLMLTGIGCAFVYGIPDIDPVVEEPVEPPLIEEVTIPVSFAGSEQLPRQYDCELTRVVAVAISAEGPTARASNNVG